MDIINSTIYNISKSSSISELIEHSLLDITRIINCKVGQYVIIDPTIVREINQKKLVVQKDKVDGRYYDIVAISDNDLGRLAFMALDEAKRDINTARNLS